MTPVSQQAKLNPPGRINLHESINQYPENRNGVLAIIGCCIAIFWPGALTFGFPGVMASIWQKMFLVGSADTGAVVFSMLAAVGIFMFLVGRWQE